MKPNRSENELSLDEFLDDSVVSSTEANTLESSLLNFFLYMADSEEVSDYFIQRWANNVFEKLVIIMDSGVFNSKKFESVFDSTFNQFYDVDKAPDPRLEELSNQPLLQLLIGLVLSSRSLDNNSVKVAMLIFAEYKALAVRDSASEKTVNHLASEKAFKKAFKQYFHDEKVVNRPRKTKVKKHSFKKRKKIEQSVRIHNFGLFEIFSNMTIKFKNKSVQLSEKEFQLLIALAENPNKTIHKLVLADKLNYKTQVENATEEKNNATALVYFTQLKNRLIKKFESIGLSSGVISQEKESGITLHTDFFDSSKSLHLPGFSISPEGIFTYQGQSIQLLYREIKLFEVLIANYPKEVPKEEIFKVVFSDLTTGTVDNLLKYLRRKLTSIGVPNDFISSRRNKSGNLGIIVAGQQPHSEQDSDIIDPE